MKRNFLLTICLTIFLLNCEAGLKENLSGIWILEEIYVENKDFMDSIHWKLVSFDKNSMTLPSTNNSTSVTEVEWDITQHSGIDSLTIKSNDKVFKGRYKLLFAQDNEDGSVYCKLINEKTTITLHKVELNIPTF